MNVKNALTAGFVATVVLSACLAVAHAAGLFAAFDLVGLVANVVAMITGATPNPIVGWVGHFCIGTVLWGVSYAIVEPKLPGPPAVRGMVFAAAPWLVMMIVVMPLAGAGPFGLALGPAVPLALLLLHLVFGATLGVAYAKSAGSAARDDVVPL